jgi:hypothetical protein
MIDKVDNLIRTWCYARLSTDAPGWPGIGLLGLILEMGPFAAGGGRKGSRPPPFGCVAGVRRRDAIMAQRIVDKMPIELQGPFEAYHIGVIRFDYDVDSGELVPVDGGPVYSSCRALSQTERAILLGLNRSTYYDRVKTGRRFLEARVRWR